MAFPVTYHFTKSQKIGYINPFCFDEYNRNMWKDIVSSAYSNGKKGCFLYVYNYSKQDKLT